MDAIEAAQLTKVYAPPGRLAATFMRSPIKRAVTAVDSVTLTVAPGELFGLIGPNGAGKTTLVKLLCTLLWPTSGTARVCGYDVMHEEHKVKYRVGFVSGEERSFHWRLTGRQNLEFFAALSDLFGAQARARIDEILERLGLADAADNMVYSYSSGMRQKLALARGLLTDPSILFLDEPTKSIDPLAARQVKEFVKGRLVGQEGRTVFLTSHRLEEVEQLCDRFAILCKGKITFCGTVSQLRKRLRPRERYALRLCGLAQQDALRVANGRKLADVAIEPDSEAASVVLRFALDDGDGALADVISDVTQRGGAVLSCAREDMRLEDMFVEHVSGAGAS